MAVSHRLAQCTPLDSDVMTLMTLMALMILPLLDAITWLATHPASEIQWRSVHLRGIGDIPER